MIEALASKVVIDYEATRRRRVFKRVFYGLLGGIVSLATVLACYPEQETQPQQDQIFIPKPDGPVRPLDPVLTEVQERNSRLAPTSIAPESKYVPIPDGPVSPR